MKFIYKTEVFNNILVETKKKSILYRIDNLINIDKSF